MSPGETAVPWPAVVVDDDQVVCAPVTGLLRKLNLRTAAVEAADGQEGCDILSDPCLPPPPGGLRRQHLHAWPWRVLLVSGAVCPGVADR